MEDLTANDVHWLGFEGQLVRAKVVDVYDGDTVTAILPLAQSFFKVKCRLLGIDAPELRRKITREAGLAAKVFLSKLILDKVVMMECGKWDKYGRLLCNITTEEGVNVNSECVAQGHAVEYFGGKRLYPVPPQ